MFPVTMYRVLLDTNDPDSDGLKADLVEYGIIAEKTGRGWHGGEEFAYWCLRPEPLVQLIADNWSTDCLTEDCDLSAGVREVVLVHDEKLGLVEATLVPVVDIKAIRDKVVRAHNVAMQRAYVECEECGHAVRVPEFWQVTEMKKRTYEAKVRTAKAKAVAL